MGVCCCDTYEYSVSVVGRTVPMTLQPLVPLVLHVIGYCTVLDDDGVDLCG